MSFTFRKLDGEAGDAALQDKWSFAELGSFVPARKGRAVVGDSGEDQDSSEEPKTILWLPFSTQEDT